MIKRFKLCYSLQAIDNGELYEQHEALVQERKELGETESVG